jgi:RNA polymerase sigma factor (sigma-70 family)
VSHATNHQIVQQLKTGDLRGCRHLVDTYQDRLLTEATQVFHIPFVDAEELVSDIMLAVVQGIQGFDFKKSDADFHFWVMAIFKNRVRDFVRHQALTEGLMERFDESAFEDKEMFSTGERDVIGVIMRNYETSLREKEPGADADSGGKLSIIVEALEKLESWERVLLRCRALDTPYEEIAKYTGKSVKQLKVYHKRVKEKFVKLLTQQYPELLQRTTAHET